MPPRNEYFNVPLRRVAFGHRDELQQPGAIKAALAEFFSTLIFVFAGAGSGIATSVVTNASPTSPSGLVSAAIAHGFALFVAVSISANISGGHVNPAVTFGLFIGGNISMVRCILYINAQLLGSIAACALLVLTTGNIEPAEFAVTGSLWRWIVFEIVMTFGLVYTVYATAVDPKKGEVGIIAPLAIGLIVAANILAGGPFTGASMNPAISFGPALLGWNWSNQWAYWVGPLIGAGLAAVVYEVFFISHTHEPVPLDY